MTDHPTTSVIEPRYVARSDLYGRQPLYALRHPWPESMFAQGGSKTMFRDATPEEVADPGVRTYGDIGAERVPVDRGVFMEVFPDTFMRAEAPTFAEAEDLLWERWQRMEACAASEHGHELETRGYRNGAGFCRHCDLFKSSVFDLAEIGSICLVCGVGTNFSHIPHLDENGQALKGCNAYDFVCEDHAPPSYSDIDAYLYGGEPMRRTPTPEQAMTLRQMLRDIGAGSWHHLDFDAKRTLVAQFQRAEVERAIQGR